MNLICSCDSYIGLPLLSKTGTVAPGFIFKNDFEATSYFPVSIRSICFESYLKPTSCRQILTFLEQSEKSL